MQWWNDFVEWLNSDDGWRVLSTAVIPFVAIVVAGLIAALIGRGSSRRIIALTERDRRTSTVSALISAARRAAKWNTLSVPEQQHAEHLLHEADTRIRMLPLNGSGMVADWAAHEVEEMKRNSVSFSFQAEQSLIEFRTRLVEWQAKPGRAKKLFKADLDTWNYEAGQADKDLVNQQKEWAKQQVTETDVTPAATPAPAPAPTSQSPAPALAAPAATPEPATEANPFQAPDYALPDSVASRRPSAPVEDWNSTGSTATVPDSGEQPSSVSSTAAADVAPASAPEDETPGPVSAGTVRQRITPEDREY